MQQLGHAENSGRDGGQAIPRCRTMGWVAGDNAHAGSRRSGNHYDKCFMVCFAAAAVSPLRALRIPIAGTLGAPQRRIGSTVLGHARMPLGPLDKTFLPALQHSSSVVGSLKNRPEHFGSGMMLRLKRRRSCNVCSKRSASSSLNLSFIFTNVTYS